MRTPSSTRLIKGLFVFYNALLIRSAKHHPMLTLACLVHTHSRSLDLLRPGPEGRHRTVRSRGRRARVRADVGIWVPPVLVGLHKLLRGAGADARDVRGGGSS